MSNREPSAEESEEEVKHGLALSKDIRCVFALTVDLKKRRAAVVASSVSQNSNNSIIIIVWTRLPQSTGLVLGGHSQCSQSCTMRSTTISHDGYLCS